MRLSGDLVEDVAARQADGVRARPHPAAHLGRDDHVLALDAEVAQSLTELHLRPAFGIDVGGVDEIHALFERAADERGRLGLVELADRLPEPRAAGEGHRAEADFRDELAGAAERSIAHAWFSRGGRQVSEADGSNRERSPGAQIAGCVIGPEERLRRLTLPSAASSRRSSSPPRPTSSPSSGRRLSAAARGDGCGCDRRPRTHAACCAR